MISQDKINGNASLTSLHYWAITSCISGKSCLTFFSTLNPIPTIMVPALLCFNSTSSLLHAHLLQILQSQGNSFEITVAATASAFNSVITLWTMTIAVHNIFIKAVKTNTLTFFLVYCL